MTGDHDALLRAVCEHPREDTPRLVFADFLEENGQAEWAQFIRRDIAMSLRDEWDADRLRWEWVEKPAVRRALWFRAMFPPLPGALKWGHAVERGFPAAVEGGVGTFRANAAEVLRLAPVDAVTFSVGDGFTDVARYPWLARIRRLGLPARFLPRDMTALVRSQFALAIEEVSGVGGPVASELVRSPLFPQLARVRLGAPGPHGWVRAFEGIPASPRLRFLELCTRLHTEPDVLRLPAVVGVEHLGVRDRYLSSAGYLELAAAVLPGLRSLDLTHTLPGLAGVRALCGSNVLAGLRNLRWGNNAINSALACEFAASPGLANLRVLELPSNTFGNDGATALFTSPHLAGLKVLDLTHCMIGDDALRALLDDSPHADGLVLLNLTGSPASAEMKQAVKDRMGDRVRV